MVTGQILVALCAFASLLAPPTRGMKMLVPLTPDAARALPALAVANDNMLMAIGPLPGSLLVYSEHPDTTNFLTFRILTIASPPAGCGARDLA